MRRTAIGIIALVLLAGSIAFWIWPLPSSNAMLEGIHGAFLRVGALMFAFWLAYPQVSKVPPWLFTGSLLSGAAIAIRPKAALVVLPVLAVVWILRPRGASKGRKSHRPRSHGDQ